MIEYDEDDLKYDQVKAAADLLEMPHPDEAGADADVDEESGKAAKADVEKGGVCC